MPDFQQTSDVFAQMVLSSAQMNPLAAEAQPSNPYSLCWCRSGKKWKFCHKNRHSKPSVSFGEVMSKRIDHFQAGQCLHPSASSQSCSSPNAIQSHTIQRRGGLASVAQTGHVYSIKKGFENIYKAQGLVDMQKLGVAKASTFPGFCNHHDTELFKPVEQPNSQLDHWNGFLLSFRAISYELATKAAALGAHVATRQFVDYGKPFEIQAAFQNYMHLHQDGLQRGRDEVSKWKAEYDRAFLQKDLSSFWMYGVTFDTVLPFVAAGAFMPEYDFTGRPLQSLATDKVLSHVALNVTKLGSSTCVVFGWIDGPNSAAAKLVASFKELSDAAKANAVLILSLEYLENFFCAPDWWEGLPSEQSTTLHDKIAGGMVQRLPNALVEPSMSAVAGGVASVLEK